MAAHFSCTLFLVTISKVVTVWIELPKIAPSTKHTSNTTAQSESRIGHNSSIVKSPQLTTFYSVLTTFSNEGLVTEPTVYMSSLPKEKTTDERTKEIKIDVEVKNRFPDTYTEDIQVETDEVVSDYEDPSSFIKDAFENEKNDFVGKTQKSIREKLNYLENLQQILYTEIRSASRGLWTKRQSRSKKLMGFGTFEGTLVTIAFLTFAVFLIKLVIQFIEGLQNKNMTMVMTVPTTSSTRRRSRRDEHTFAAAKILQYMDEYTINHRPYCDDPDYC